MNQPNQPAIEILSVDLLDRHRPLVEDLRRLAKGLGLEFGWHYLLDLTWILARLGEVSGKRIMDAGAGVGVMQWYLAERGATVYSVDRGSRADLSPRFRGRYRVRGLRPEDLRPTGAVTLDLLRRGRIKEAGRGILSLVSGALGGKAPGEVLVYNRNLMALEDIPDETLDAVVAVSALEHNPPEDLPRVVAEMTRVLKPGGVLLATLGAAREADWFHEASRGWCYQADSLRRLFGLSADTPDNYDRYDELFDKLKHNAELRDNLAGFYFKSGDNGMPWGKWEPQYQPVGVCRPRMPTNAHE